MSTRSHELESGTTLIIPARFRRRAIRRVARLLGAALVVLALVFLAGYLASTNGGLRRSSVTVVRLVGTANAPDSRGLLRVEPADAAGNQQLQLAVSGLPRSPPRGYYELDLVRAGKPWASSGRFRVTGSSARISVGLNAPYPLREHDSWIVLRETPGQREPGAPVLTPRG